MAETSQWRASACIVMLFLIAAFIIEGRELLNFERSFNEVRGSWLPVQAAVEEKWIATVERRSGSTRAGAVAYVTQFAPGVRAHYTVNGKPYDVAALGWSEPLRAFAQWEGRGVETGRVIPIRVDPQAPDHATLLGEWTPASSIIFGRLFGIELLILCAMIVCGKFVIRRTA
jgi:hypothetical protein